MGESFKLASGDRDDTAWPAHPETALRVFRYKVNLIAGQSCLGRELRQRPVFEQEEAGAVRADPNSALGIRMQRPDLQSAKSLEHRISDGAAGMKPAQAAIRRHPQVAAAIQQERPDAAVCQTVICIEILKRALMEAAQAAVRADPDAAFPIFAEGADEIIDEAFFHRVPDDSGRVNSRDPLPVGAEPQRPVAVAEHIAHRHPAQAGGKSDWRERLSRDPE